MERPYSVMVTLLEPTDLSKPFGFKSHVTSTADAEAAVKRQERTASETPRRLMREFFIGFVRVFSFLLCERQDFFSVYFQSGISARRCIIGARADLIFRTSCGNAAQICQMPVKSI